MFVINWQDVLAVAKFTKWYININISITQYIIISILFAIFNVL